MINYKFCFVALNVFFTIFAMGVGLIKSLKNFAWLANLNIWLSKYYPLSSSCSSSQRSQTLSRSSSPLSAAASTRPYRP